MRGRKNLRRMGIVLGLGALLCAGVMASGALGMALVDPGSTDSTSTAADTTPASTDPTPTDASSSSSTSADTTGSTTTDAAPPPTTTDTSSSTTTTTSTSPFTPTISSDKENYLPGATVRLTGAGWGAGEGVHIFINDDVGQAWSYNGDVTADSTGVFTSQVTLPSFFIADYTVTATGTSGAIAKAAFTDGAARDGDGVMVVSPTSAAAGSTNNNFSFTFTADPGKDFSSGSQVTLLVPGVWSQPRISGSSAGRVTVASGATCTAVGAPAISSGSGPWTITVDMTCDAKQSFTLVYSNVAAPSPTSTTLYSFDTKSKQSGGTLTAIAASPTVNVTVAAKTNQTISFTSAAPTSAVFGDQYTPTATATSGLTVTFGASGACSYDGVTGKVTMTSVGTCLVTADQTGNASFNPAPQITQSFTVGKANQAALSVTAPNAGVFGQSLQIVSSGGSGAGAVSYSVGASAACALNGTDATKLDITAGSGSCSVTATKAGDANYNSTSSSAHAVTVSKADQAALSVTAPTSGTFGDHLSISETRMRARS